jgi:type IV pilus assembly protein PilB
MSHIRRSTKKKRLGDILVDEGLATKEAVIRALHEQQKSHRLLSDILLDEGELSPHDLARVVVDQYQVPFLDLERYSLHKDLVEQFPAALLHAAAVVPLDRFGPQVCFACQEIPGEAVAEKLRQHVEGTLQFFVAVSTAVREVLAEHVKLAGDENKVRPKPKAVLPTPDEIDEDAAWKDLFDSADKEILQDLKSEDD